MAETFAMDPQPARAGLSSADTAAASQLGRSVGTIRVGGYATALMGTIAGTRTAHQAEAEIRAAANIASRESSFDAVETAEATNSGVLST